MFKRKRFLVCGQGVVALEGALASIPLILCLAGVFEIVQTIFMNDLIQRAAHRVARTTALAGAAANSTALENRVRQAIDAEVGNMLDFDLTMSGTCTGPALAAHCLAVSVDVYDDPSAMVGTAGNPPTPSSGPNANLGGDGGDMVVVRLHLQPRSVLGQVQQQLYGTSGLGATAVVRNEP